MRPYTWRNYYVQPGYTYKFDLTGSTGDIYDIFHTSIKNAMKKALRNENIYISNDHKYIYDILSLVAKRYKDQNKKFRISENYIRNLMGTSVSDNIESIAIINNRYTVAGDITLTDRNKAYAWIGTVSRDENIPGAGELLLWKKIMEYKQRGLTEYDFVGANTRHICKHKAKFGAKLVPYFTAHKTSLKGKIALKIMKGSERDFYQ
jgi:lipid II:glycine glycyltransferase (peptidoglycan interpeptide bridge formation enzyme)